MLIRNALREEKLAELKTELKKESETEIKKELDFCRELQEAYDFIKNSTLWYDAFLGNDHIYGVDEIRKCWQESLDDEKKSQAVSAYVWAMLNQRPATQFSWSYLHFLCLGQNQTIWGYRQIERNLEKLRMLRSDDLESVLWSWQKNSRYLTRRLIVRLKDNAITKAAQDFTDQVLAILRVEVGIEGFSTDDKIKMIANILTKSISFILIFLRGHLIPLKEAMEKAQQTYPNYLEMSCQEAAGILLAMHCEGRGLNFQTPQERTAYDHVLQGWHQDRQNVCKVLRGIFTTDSTEKQEAAWWSKVERLLAAKQVSQ